MNAPWRRYLLCSVLLTYGSAIRAESDSAAGPELSGVLGMDVKAGARPYTVVGDLFVPPGTTVNVAAGTVFLFESFSGLHVQGTLRCHGTKDRPVVFTSRNDRDYHSSAMFEAAPFDWNGIDIDEGAIGTIFTDCFVRYSVYGIKSQTERFRLTNVRFALNGKADLTIGGEPRKLDEKPFSYGTPASADQESMSTASGGRARIRTAVRYTGLALAIGGCAAGLWASSEYPGVRQRFEAVNNPDSTGALRYTSADWEAAKRIRDQDFALLVGGWFAGLIGAIGFGMTFTF